MYTFVLSGKVATEALYIYVHVPLSSGTINWRGAWCHKSWSQYV